MSRDWIPDSRYGKGVVSARYEVTIISSWNACRRLANGSHPKQNYPKRRQRQAAVFHFHTRDPVAKLIV
jgi:hypothetical protein